VTVFREPGERYTNSKETGKPDWVKEKEKAADTKSLDPFKFE
jgi:hypothetical protein